MRFKTINKENVNYEDICNLIDDYSQYDIFVGTDSKVKKKENKVVYATCIVVYHKGRGGRIFISKERKKLTNSLRERLSFEVWRSIEASMDLLKVNSNLNITIHIDVNKSKKYKSSEYSQELAAMCAGQGFKFELKPDAFCATTIADRVCKRGEII